MAFNKIYMTMMFWRGVSFDKHLGITNTNKLIFDRDQLKSYLPIKKSRTDLPSWYMFFLSPSHFSSFLFLSHDPPGMMNIHIWWIKVWWTIRCVEHRDMWYFLMAWWTFINKYWDYIWWTLRPWLMNIQTIWWLAFKT